MIRVVNIRNYVHKEGEILIKVDRSNKYLGNRFYMKTESQRDEVCDKYQEWFDNQIKNNNEDVLNELRRIYKVARDDDIALGCWCYPKRCHAETILNFLSKYLDDVKL